MAPAVAANNRCADRHPPLRPRQPAGIDPAFSAEAAMALTPVAAVVPPSIAAKVVTVVAQAIAAEVVTVVAPAAVVPPSIIAVAVMAAMFVAELRGGSGKCTRSNQCAGH
jgi:hypothetical protein